MGEGYECDRCGSLNSGTPHTLIALGDGEPRFRRGGMNEHPVEIHPGQEQFDLIKDLCPGCRAKFEEWWEEGGETSDA